MQFEELGVDFTSSLELRESRPIAAALTIGQAARDMQHVGPAGVT